MPEESQNALPEAEPSAPPLALGMGATPELHGTGYVAEIEQRISALQPQIKAYGEKYVDLALRNFELRSKYADDPETKKYFEEQLALAKRLRPTPEQIDAALKERESADVLFKKYSGEYKAPPIYPKEDFMDFASIALFFAALSGFATNDPFLTSLTSFTRAMEGYMTGRKESADRNYELFKDNFNRGLQQRNAAHESVKRILEDEKMPLDAKIAQSNYYLGLSDKQSKTLGDVYKHFTDTEKMLYNAEIQFLKMQHQKLKDEHEKTIEGIVRSIAVRDKLAPEQQLELLTKFKSKAAGVIAGATTGARISAYEKYGVEDYKDAAQVIQGTLAYTDIPAARGKRRSRWDS
jgi:hypothetical protein